MNLEKKIFENGGHVHVYSPTTVVKYFSLTNLFSQFSPSLLESTLNDFLTDSPIQTFRRPNLSLP